MSTTSNDLLSAARSFLNTVLPQASLIISDEFTVNGRVKITFIRAQNQKSLYQFHQFPAYIVFCGRYYLTFDNTIEKVLFRKSDLRVIVNRFQ